MEVAILRRFEELIRARSGIQMRAPEATLLAETLGARMVANRFDSLERYLNFLSSGLPDTHGEWTKLFQLLTNQESYFFRDSDQLSLIRDRLLPGIIERNRLSRTLRIWSAGCSTGEEPYSLAMMLEDVLPQRDGWRILILGTDISEAALERARRGLYGAWSFRALDGAQRDRFFTPRGKAWEVKPALRSAVTFEIGNLFGDAFPSASNHLHDMDLILCRNVFIYFGRDEVAQVLRKFSATLHPAGFLMTGHAELHGAPLGDLKMQSFPQSMVYQRASGPTRGAIPRDKRDLSATSLSPAVSPSSPVSRPVAAAKTPSASPSASRELPAASAKTGVTLPLQAQSLQASKSGQEADWITQAISLLRSGRAGAAMEKLRVKLEGDPNNPAGLCLAAQALANLGHLDEAETFCRRALAVSPFAALPYHVLARIAGERGEDESAKSLLKKVIYLSPSSVRAYLELSALYARENNTSRAIQMTRAALGILSGQSAETLVPAEEYDVEEPLRVGEIWRQLQADSDELKH